MIFPSKVRLRRGQIEGSRERSNKTGRNAEKAWWPQSGLREDGVDCHQVMRTCMGELHELRLYFATARKSHQVTSIQCVPVHLDYIITLETM